MKMKHRLFSAALVAIAALIVCPFRCTQFHQPEGIPADDPHFQFTGRIDFSDPKAPLLYWPGTYIKTKFEGTSFRLILDDQRGDNFYNVFIDGQWDAPVIVDCDSGRQIYAVATGLPDTVHRLMVFRRTEGFSGWTRFLGVQLDPGRKLLAPDPRPPRLIEFYGNSITCGMGNEAPEDSSDDNNAERNNFLAYGAITARNLNAEYVCIAKSGIGVVKSWFPVVMPEYYYRLNPADPDSRWDFSTWQPDVVVLNLFQNDAWLVPKMNPVPAADEIVDAYGKFVGTIRGHYPDATIICTLGVMDAIQEGKPWPGYIEQAVAKHRQANGDTHIYVKIFSDQGFYKHPRVRHHRKMADELTAFIKEKMEW